jgi:hypothetical protein
LAARYRRVIATVIAALLPTLAGASVRAEPPTSDVSFYVSDQFKRVAKRVFSQLTADVIANRSCPANQPLCKPVADTMAAAFNAALSKDPVATEAALGDFFVTSSVAAFLHSIGRILPEKADPSWSAGSAPLFRCIVGRLSGISGRKVCVADGALDAVKAFVAQLKRADSFGAHDQHVMNAVVQAVATRNPIDAGDALRVLAAIASSKLVERQDVRVYLLALSDWVREGLTDGLFPASYAYLAHLDATIVSETSVLDVRDGTAMDNYDFVTPAGTQAARQAAVACHKDPAPIDQWTTNAATYFASLRANLLRGLPMDLSPFRAIAAMGDCADPTEPALSAFHRKLRYMQGSLEVEQARIKFGLAGLSAAALIDYVRTADDKQLLRSLRTMLVYGLARFSLYRANHTVPAKPSVSTVEEALRSCEFQTLELDLGTPVSRNPTTPGQCKPLAGGEPQPAPLKPAAGAVAQVLDNALTKVMAQLRDGWDALPPQSLLADTYLDELAHAAQLLHEDDAKGATRTLLRFGVDLMVEKVDAMVTGMLGSSDSDCVSDAASRSIFTGLGGRCALHLLVQGAYEPVADYFSKQGQRQSNPSQLAGTVYKNLLATPYLDSTPVILNVGLGANYIRGHQDVWGGNGTGALTLIDKLGVAFYKRSWQNFRCETGPFVGGFLDALVRALDGQSQPYWLAGYTVGMPRMWGADFGIEVHAAAVMPFALDRSHRYGAAFGGALVVPFNFVFGEGNP